ncbi:DUF1559 family PulG-like putative transporter [Neorhodopirellula pilleata]|uniref:DUF1559 domain-containing protein n=1 Tax=Neorhodopirellula pilleata TaxID=2714738 RepID=A0A5C5ZZH4_9BACT|nr:DUF1559 domain-containing protein [Neorhodopirellula pilleata]TWT92972.1 hypothetical protein Pla100_42880 [Neorhodopirellula pilleata]
MIGAKLLQLTFNASDDTTVSPNVQYAAMGPVPYNLNYIPWRTQIPTLLCPSDLAPSAVIPNAVTNYGVSLGDSFWNCNNTRNAPAAGEPVSTGTPANIGQHRGFFKDLHTTAFRDVLDGLSNTVAMGELVRSAGQRELVGDVLVRNQTNNTVRDDPKVECWDFGADPQRPRFYRPSPAVELAVETSASGNRWRGSTWAQGEPMMSAVTITFPPNGPNFVRGNGDANGPGGIFAVASRHQGGAHVLMGDGAVRFVTDSIDSGNLSSRPVGVNGGPPACAESPYGLWGALGSNAAKEPRSIDEI